MPSNLPTASAVPEYLTNQVDEEVTEDDSNTDLKDVEDRAHSRYTLLSSDAIRYFVNQHPDAVTRLSKLDEVIDSAKAAYPSEDGWLVLNLSRIQEILESDSDSKESFKTVAEVLTGAGSLAEAILAGNFKQALELIEDRPMISLANATADLDAAYRYKQGIEVGADSTLSELLKKEADRVGAEKIASVIRALTTAIDGHYTNENVAVKTAIMKAIAELEIE